MVLIDFSSLSTLSIEKPDEVPVGGTFSVVHQDDLLNRLLSLDEKYCLLLRRTQITFLGTTGIAAFES
jgi:hypothetical protein